MWCGKKEEKNGNSVFFLHFFFLSFGRKKGEVGIVIVNKLLTFLRSKNERENQKNSFTLYSSKDVRILHLILKTNPLLSTSRYALSLSFPQTFRLSFRPITYLPTYLQGKRKGRKKRQLMRYCGEKKL